MTLEEKWNHYYGLCHAMQSGVALKMGKDPTDMTPKHLRVGVNTAMCENAALSKLLVKKGLITDDEYVDSLIEMMKDEILRYRHAIAELFGIELEQIRLDGY